MNCYHQKEIFHYNELNTVNVKSFREKEEIYLIDFN
jgi:hypothetical protein